jgi:hypothetical protein
MQMGEKKTNADFEVNIAKAANRSVGNYSSTEHRTFMDQLHYGCFNLVFELAGGKYLLWPEPAARGSKKWQARAMSEGEAVPKKYRGTNKWRRASS